MTALPLPTEESLGDAALRIFNAQLAIKSLCEARDALTGQIAEQYRIIETEGYPIRLYLAETKTDSLTIDGFECALKLDDKRLKVARVLFASTGEARILPRTNTSRLVVRKAKP